jgi:hypothetical protein
VLNKTENAVPFSRFRGATRGTFIGKPPAWFRNAQAQCAGL